MDDLILIKQTQNGNTSAFRFLVLRYQRPVFQLLGALIYDKNTVEELAQETFLRAYKSIETFTPDRGTTFSAWLFTIARNLAYNESARRKVRYEKSNLADSSPNISVDTQEDVLLQQERTTLVRRAISELPESFRSAVVLSFLNGHTCAEIAAIEGCSEGTVKSRIHRGKKMLRELLTPLLGRHHGNHV